MCLDEKSLAVLEQFKQDHAEYEETVETETSAEMNENETRQKTAKGEANAVASLVAYLIGVRPEQFGKEFDPGVFERMEGEDAAKIVRSLCAIRNSLLRQPKTIMQEMQMNMKNLDTMPELIDPEYFRYLESKGIRLIKGSRMKPIVEYVVCINQEISNRINNCLNLVPAYVNKDYIRDMIVIPGGTKEKEAQAMIDRMKAYYNSYPFHCAINWPMEAKYFHTDVENILDPKPEGNILLNDRRFLTLLYRVHGEDFTDYGRFSDAAPETKERLGSFVNEHTGTVLLVDCENADPFKLVAALDSLRGSDALRNGGIGKIVLFDDYHTVDAWDILENHVKIPVEHEEVERVLGNKSLVDIALTAGACRMHWEEGVNSFMIASSDSDFWGMMRAMPDASFLILAEDSKISRDAVRVYDEHGIGVCMVDDFAANLAGLREDAVRIGIEKRLNNVITLNLYDMMDGLYDSLRLTPSCAERENDLRRYGRSLKAEIGPDGEISFRIVA